MMGAGYKVLLEWFGNARFSRYDGCGMHGSTGMMGAGYNILLEWYGGCTVQTV